MGERIDRAALLLLWCGGCFALFLYWTGVIWLSALCAFAASVLMRLALGKYGGRFFLGRQRKKNRARLAGQVTLSWVYLPYAEALSAVRGVVEGGLLLHSHPDGQPADINAVLDIWREHRGEKTTRLCSTGSFSDKAILLARTLSAPEMELYDHAALARLVEKSLPEDARPEAFKRRNPLPALALRSANWRNAAYSALLFALYWFLRVPAYLAASLGLAGLCAAGYHLRKRRPI